MKKIYRYGFLMLFILITFFNNLQAQNIWDGSVDTAWYDANQNTYYIANGAELAGIAFLVNNNICDFSGKTVVLANDIWLNANDSTTNNWTPIGGFATATNEVTYSEKYFKGNFDGNEHTIYNLYCNKGSYFQVGLFGTLSGNLTIQDLAMANPTLIGAGMMGAITGFCSYGGSIHINNCIVMNASLTGSTGNNIGCVLGANYSNSNGTIINSCGATGTLNGHYVGGLCGNGQYTIISNSYFAGTLTDNNGSNSLGGINAYSGTLNNCYSNVTSISSGNSGTVVTSTYMQSDTFSMALDTTFKMDDCSKNGGYPIKSWQICDVPVDGDLELCLGETTTLTASYYQSYVWSTGSTSNTITVSPTVTTTYYVTGTSVNGVQVSDSVTVTVFPQAVITATAMPSYDGLTHGTVTPESTLIPCASTQQITLTITPDAGWHISSIVLNGTEVRGSDATDGSVVTYVIDPQGTLADVKIYFYNKFNVTASMILSDGSLLNETGLISPWGNNGVTEVEYDSSITYNLLETGRYHINDVVISGNSSGILHNYTFYNVTDNYNTIQVVYDDVCGINTLPYSENFDLLLSGNWIDCWSRLNNYINPSITTNPNYSSPNAVNFYSGYSNSAMVISPLIDSNNLLINNMQVSFELYKTSTNGNFIVGVISDPTDMSTFVGIDTIIPSASNTWESFTVYFASYTGNAHYIAFNYYDGRYNNTYLDEVVFDLAPDCSPIQNLQITSVNYDNTNMGTAVMTWAPGVIGTATEYTVEYAVAESAAWIYAGTTTTPTFTITGLASGTQYDVRVSQTCGTSISDYAYSFFVTTCDTLDQCSVQFTLHANSSLGWYNNYLNVYVNGLNSYQLGVSSGTTDVTYSINICPDDSINLYWKVNYSWAASYASFTVENSYGEEIYSCTNGSSLSANTVIHSFVGNCTPPSCPRPEQITTNNVTGTTATVEWVDNYASEWLIEYGLAGFTKGHGTLMACTSNPFTLTSLSAGSSYDLYIRSVCSTVDTSIYSLKASFNTECAEISEASLPFSENFDGTLEGDYLRCWTRYASNSEHMVYCYTSSSYYYSSPRSLDFHWTPNCYTIAILPKLDNNLNANQLRINFQAQRTGTTSVLEIGIMTDDTIPSSFVPIDTIDASTVNQWYANTVDFSNYTGNGKYIAMKVSNGTECGFRVDNVVLEKIPTCFAPENLSADNITTSSANLSWVDNNATVWNIEYVENGFAQGSGVQVQNVSNPYTVNGLNAQTTYNFYVQSICNVGDTSTWAGPYNFTTACSFMTLPFTEDFENEENGTNTPLPLCWTRINDATGTYTYFPVVFDNTYGDAYAGTGYLRFCVATGSAWPTNEYAVLPPIDIATDSLNTLQVSFYARKFTAIYESEIMVGVMTNPSDASTFELIATVNPSSTTYEEITIPFGNYHGTANYIAIKMTRGNANRYCFVDNVTVDYMPYCPQPTNLSVANINSTSLDLSWSENGQATAWNVEYGPVGFISGQGTILNFVSTTGTITGLTPNTNYDFYVQSDCGSSTSQWEGPYNVSTYLCDSSARCSFIMNLYDHIGDGWHGNSIDIYQNDTLVYNVTLNFGQSLVQSIELCDGKVTTFKWNASITADEISFAIVHPSGEDIYICTSGSNLVNDSVFFTYIVNCEEVIPYCAIPNTFIATNITETGADVTWTPGNAETAWLFEYKKSNETDYTQMQVSGTPSVSLTNLEPQTTYNVRAKALCTYLESDYSFIGEFTTAETPVTTYTIHAIAGENGTITPEGDTVVTEGAEVTYYIVADENYIIQEVFVDQASVGAVENYTFTNILANHEIEATFQLSGIVNYSLENAFLFYPNPTSSTINIRCNNAAISMQKIALYDIYGKLLQTVQPNNESAIIDLQYYSSGVYFITITSNEGVITQKIIKK